MATPDSSVPQSIEKRNREYLSAAECVARFLVEVSATGSYMYKVWRWLSFSFVLTGKFGSWLFVWYTVSIMGVPIASNTPIISLAVTCRESNLVMHLNKIGNFLITGASEARKKNRWVSLSLTLRGYVQPSARLLGCNFWRVCNSPSSSWLVSLRV